MPHGLSGKLPPNISTEHYVQSLFSNFSKKINTYI